MLARLFQLSTLWKSDVSLEGPVASFVGPVVTVIPSWEDLMISHDTVVFRGAIEGLFMTWK